MCRTTKLTWRRRRRLNPFIMNPEGVARFFAVNKMNEGPFPEHYEPFETPIGINPLHPQNKKATSNPAARIFDSVWDTLRCGQGLPLRAPPATG